MPGRDGPVIYLRIVPETKAAERYDASERVLSLTFEDNDNKADKLTLEIDNRDLSNFDEPRFRHGAVLEAQWGYEGNMCPTRSCVIQKVTGFQKLHVEALARSILLHKDKRARKWTGLKRSQVVERIADEWGYDAQHRDIEDTEITCETIHQAGVTDASFLTQMAKREGFVWYIDHTGLHFHRRKFEQKPKRVFHWYGDPGRGDVLAEPTIENDVTRRPGKVTVKSRDPLKRTTVTGDGSTSATKHSTLAPNVQTAEKIEAITGTTRLVTRNIVSTETVASSASSSAAAKREADGRFLGSAALTVKLKAPIVGDPQLLAKTIGEWRGLGKRLSGNYYLRQVTTHIEDGGFKQDVQFLRNGVAETGLPRSSGKLNTQKGPETKAGSTGTNAVLKSEKITASDGTTKIIYRKQ